MLTVLEGFPSLSQLRFTLIDDIDHGKDHGQDPDLRKYFKLEAEVWWKEEIMRRLSSRLHAAISVSIILYGNGTFFL